MQFSREIRRILFGTLSVLAAVGLSATYWAVTGQGSILLREDNPRLIEAASRIQRGSIYDRYEQMLAETVASEAGLERQYPVPAAYSAVGYYSLRYGDSSAESAFDDALGGSSDIESLADLLNKRIMRRPQVGSDIRLTMDADIQNVMVDNMGDLRGAAVVIDARTGALLALASLPSYDPNTLDEEWEALVEAEGNPFFNRALQGQYQLGGGIYTLWLAQAIASQFDLSLRFTDSAGPVDLGDDTTIACVIAPPEQDLSLLQAYIYGCPAAFRSYHQLVGPGQYDEVVSPFAFESPITLPDFPVPEPVDLPAAADSEETDPKLIELRNALGQGDLTTTPLHWSAMMAAVANDGVATMPHIGAAQRDPDAMDWRPIHSARKAVQMIAPETARELREVLTSSWMTLQDQPTPTGVEVGAQIATSQSGEGMQLWLNGFLASDDGDAFAFVIVLENTQDLGKLITLGQTLTEALAKGR